MIEVYTKSDPKYVRNFLPFFFLSRKIFILKRINFRAEPFESKFGTNFPAFWTFCANARNLVRAKISTIKVYIINLIPRTTYRDSVGPPRQKLFGET